MNTAINSAARGRPKTLSRVAVTEVAMRAYWAEGVDSVSLSEICRRASVSKPGLYREFGSEDGLTLASLDMYFDRVIAPLVQMLTSALTFREKLDVLTQVAAGDHAERDNPLGCLFTKMRGSGAALGKATQARVEYYEGVLFKAFKRMVSQAKAQRDVAAQLSTLSGARYIDAQLVAALSQQARGDSPKAIRDVLGMAFSVFD